MSALGLDESDIDLVVDEGFYADRTDNNPRPVGVEDAHRILRTVS